MMRLSLVLFITNILTFFAQEQPVKGIDQRIEEMFKPVSDFWTNLVFTSIPIAGFNVPVVLIILILGAAYFTFYFRIPQFKLFKTAIKVVAGKYDKIDHHGSMTVAGDPTPNEDNTYPKHHL